MARLLTALLALTCAIATATAAATELHPLSDAFINLINSKQNTWTAGRNFAEDTPIEYFRRPHIVKNKTLHDQLSVTEQRIPLRYSLPENFDLRKVWPNCPSLNEIRDEGSCKSDWAMVTVSTMTDRYCIQSGGKQFHFSAEDLLSCSMGGYCHRGGNSVLALDYWTLYGLVSGGNYGSNQGCRPYSIKPCIHYGPDQDGLKKCTGHDATPQCKRQCREGYEIPYEKDLRYIEGLRGVTFEENIMLEIMKRGPVQTQFTLFEDFLHYKSGIYHYTAGKYLGGQHAKILGWGVENGFKYWILANSWNKHFGDKGFFKMPRGSDECDLEDFVFAADPTF